MFLNPKVRTVVVEEGRLVELCSLEHAYGELYKAYQAGQVEVERLKAEVQAATAAPPMTISKTTSTGAKVSLLGSPVHPSEAS